MKNLYRIWRISCLLLFLTAPLSLHASIAIKVLELGSKVEETPATHASSTDQKRRHKRPIAKNLIELEAEISKVMAAHRLPALGVGLVNQNGDNWVRIFGYGDLETMQKADLETRFRVGSTSKMLVALAVLKLIERGDLSLTDRLKDLAPEIEFDNPWQASHPVRLLHLLTHTTGWDEQHYPEFGHNESTPIRLRDALAFHPHSRRSRWAPGTRYAYNNTGPAVAAYLVEQVTGTRFEGFVQQHFFAPMAMNNSGYFNHEKVANSYTLDHQRIPYEHLLTRPSGALNSTVPDMMTLLSYFLNRGRADGTTLLSKASIELMEKPNLLSGQTAGLETGYGLNNYSSNHGPLVYREHNGGMLGAMSEFAYLPAYGLGHVIVSNTKNVAALQQLSRLIRDYERQSLRVPDFELEPVEVTAAHKAIEGMYYAVNPRVQVFDFLHYITNMRTFHFDGHTLVQGKAVGSSKNYYVPVSNYEYRSTETGLVSLLVTQDPEYGEVLHYAYGKSSNQNYVLKRISSWLGYGQILLSIFWLLLSLFSFIYAAIWCVIWGVKALRRKPRANKVTSFRLWPWLISLSLFVLWFLLGLASNKPYLYMAAPTPVSVGIMLITLLYAALVVKTVIVVIKTPRENVSKRRFGYASVFAFVHALMTIQLAYFGLIGVIFWA